MGYVGKGNDWYLIAWCRLRQGVRAFRGDRIQSIVSTGERPARRVLDITDLEIQFGTIRGVAGASEER